MIVTLTVSVITCLVVSDVNVRLVTVINILMIVTGVVGYVMVAPLLTVIITGTAPYRMGNKHARKSTVVKLNVKN